MSALIPIARNGRKEDFELCEIEESVHIEEEEDITAVEYVLPMQKFSLIENYFGNNPKSPESIEIEIDGRKVTINGINEELAAEEFEKTLNSLVEPVVNSNALKTLLDSFIVREVTLMFSRLHPSFSARERASVLQEVFRLHEEEREELFREIDRFEGISAPPGEVREALGRLSSEKLKRILIEAVDPIVTSEELQEAQEAIRIKQLKQPFKDLIDPVVKPKELWEAMQKLPDELEKQFKSTFNLVEKRIEVFLTLIDEYHPLHIIKFVLGEEWYKRMEKSIPIKWKLPKENVPKLHEFIECQIKGVQERYSNPDAEDAEMAANSLKIAEALIKEPFREFQAIQDYYVEDEMIPLFISVVKMPLHPWPRLEKVKQALRVYFRIDNSLKYASDPMLMFIEHLKKRLSNEARDHLAEDLRNASKDEIVGILQSLNAPAFTEEERLAFVQAVQIFLPKENEILMGPIEYVLDATGVHIDLYGLDRSAKSALETVCRDAELQVVFRQNGKDIYLGSAKMSQKEVEEYLAELEEDPDYVKPH